MLQFLASFMIETSNQCGWMLNSRVWRPTEPCTLNSTHDLQLWEQYSDRDLCQLDFAVVNVYDFSKRDDGMYDVLEIAPTGLLKNAFLVVNATIDMSKDPDADSLFVSIFDSFMGSVQNVSVTGFVNITNVDFAKVQTIVLSKFFGSTLLASTPSFQNIFSNLRFFIGAATTLTEITANNQVISGVTVKLVTTFDNLFTSADVISTANLDIPVPTLTQTIATMLTATKLYVIDYTWNYPYAITTKTYTAFDTTRYFNPFWDYYIGANGITAEYSEEIKIMNKKYFDASGNEVVWPKLESQYEMVVYYGMAKVITFFKNQYAVTCNDQQFFDPKLRACVTRSACVASKVLLQSLCLSACPTGLTNVSSICHVACPLRSKQTPNSLGGCSSCSTTFAQATQCSSTCPTGYFTFQGGCFQYCPEGMIVSGTTCTVATSETNCKNAKFLYLVAAANADSTQYINFCSNETIPGFYNTRSATALSSTLTYSCTGTIIHYDGSCQTSGNVGVCNKTNGLSMIKDPIAANATFNCRLSCLQGEMNNSYQCNNVSCQDLTYPQRFFGNCLPCESEIYDYGIYWSRLSAQCVKTCAYWNISSGRKTCETKDDPVNCPKYLKQADGTYQCLANCNGYVDAANECMASCPASLPYLDSTGKICGSSCNFYTVDSTGKLQCLSSCTWPSGLHLNPLYQNNYSQCVTACPNGLIMNREDQHCISDCSYVNKSNSSQVYCETKDDPLNCNYYTKIGAIYQCLTACSVVGQLVSSDGHLCTDKCNAGEFLSADSTKCSTTCPSGAYSVLVNGTYQCAADKCPVGNLTGQYLGYTQCIDTCNKFQQADGKCYDFCPELQFSVVGEIKKCTACNTTSGGVFIWVDFRGQMVKQCYACDSTDQIIHSDFVCNKTICKLETGNAILTDVKTCVTLCPFIDTLDHLYCVACGAKPNGYTSTIVNATPVNICEAACPSDKPYYDSTTKVNITPQCVAKCPESAKYLETDLTCTAACVSNSFIVDTTKTQQYICQTNNCPDKYIMFGTQKQCITSCTAEYPYLDGKECRATCSFYSKTTLVNGTQFYTCSTSCPTFFITDSSNNKQCVSDCGPLFVSGMECKQTCAFYSYNGTNKICLTNCSSGVSGVDLTIDSTVPRCESSCSLITAKPYQSGTQCFAKCPSPNVYLNQTDKTCHENCPIYSNATNIDISTYVCLDKCPNFYEVDAQGNTHCVATCAEASGKPFANGQQCLSKCTVAPNLLIQSNTCVSACTDNRAISIDGLSCDANCLFYTDNLGVKRCIAACNSTYPFTQVFADPRYECVAECPNKQYNNTANGKECTVCEFFELQADSTQLCVSSCSSGMYTVVGSSKKCVTNCPVYELDGPLKRCYDNCSLTANNHYTVIVSDTDKYCSNNCTPAQPFLDAATLFCTATCASKLYQVISGVPNCITECPLNTTNDKGFNTTDHTRCLGECSQSTNNLYVQVNANNTGLCVDKCPADHTFLNPTLKQCVVSCDPKFYITNDTVLTCVAKCDDPSLPDSVYNRPIPGIKDHTECAPNCYGSTPFKMPDNTCVAVCPSGYFALDKTCVTACPADRKYIIDESLPDGVQQRCQAQCPKYFVISNKQFICQDCDTASKYYQVAADGQKQCVDKCDDVQFYEEDHQCTAQCASKLHDGQKCVTKCPHVYEVIDTVGVCIDNCSLSTHGNNVHDAVDGLVCIPSCAGQPVNFIEDVISGERTCVAACPLPKRLDNVTNKCDETCFYKIVNTVRICMDDHNSCDTWMEYNHGPNDIECKFDCTKYIDGSACRDTCSSGIYKVVGELKYCIDSCPDKWGYDLTINPDLKRCAATCAEMNNLPLLQTDGKQCVVWCPVYFEPTLTCLVDNSTCKMYREFNLSIVCVLQCKTTEVQDLNQCKASCDSPDRPFLEPLTKNCTDKCMSGAYDETNTCKDSSTCTLYYITADGQKKCVTSCPAQFPYIQGVQCVDKCDAGLFIYNGVCSATCGADKPYKENGFCVAECSTKTYDSVTMLCLNNTDACTYYDIIAGIKSCQVSCKYQVYDKWCTGKCPEETIKLGKNCYNPKPGKDCDKYIERDFCVEICSPSFVVINNICTPTVKCAFGEIMDQKGQCIKYENQIHTITPDGDLMLVECKIGMLFGTFCVPAKCKPGFAWIVTGCYEEKYCDAPLKQGICFVDDDTGIIGSSGCSL
ncbi:Conserved_hypothetical protein [Hexamita inflata]|uniref:Uncharacterized protein n=1 Tax=Hexamita inflata TaxID=28002 RepID=A0AA86PWM9_9EUKA|nr:Conserved hypothetical protein [Hexamita inflata]